MTILAYLLFQGFVAKPATLPDGSVNLMLWNCVVPGRQGVSKTHPPARNLLICSAALCMVAIGKSNQVGRLLA